MIGEAMIVLHIYNILFSSHLYFIEGQRGACAYIVVVFATQILACPTRSPESLLENRQYCTRVTRGRQTFLVTLSSAILNVCCSTTRRSGNSL